MCLIIEWPGRCLFLVVGDQVCFWVNQPRFIPGIISRNRADEMHVMMQNTQKSMRSTAAATWRHSNRTAWPMSVNLWRFSRQRTRLSWSVDMLNWYWWPVVCELGFWHNEQMVISTGPGIVSALILGLAPLGMFRGDVVSKFWEDGLAEWASTWSMLSSSLSIYVHEYECKQNEVQFTNKKYLKAKCAVHN